MPTKKLSEIIKNTNNIVFFGGAGVSTESGIPDFRSESGLYTTARGHRRPPEYMLSRSCYLEEPEDFYSFMRKYLYYPNVLPNDAHKSLVKLEEMGKLRAVVTQNIDGLHQKAGSKKVLELHGTLARNYCVKCGKEYDMDFMIHSQGVPHCTCGGTVRPDIVLYEEGLDMNIMEEAIDYISHADCLIVGGTSLVVYPAAGLIRYFRGSDLVLINKSPTPYDNMAKVVIHDSIAKTLKAAVDELE